MDWIVDLVERVMGLLPGLWVSLQLTAGAVAAGIPLGFLAGLALQRRNRWITWPIIGLVEIFRGFPALLTLYLVYFGLAGFYPLDAFTSVVIAFGLTTGAYSSEIFRTAIASVPRGQLEAADALGLTSWQRLRTVVLPHVLTIAVPPVIGIVIISFQGSALAYAIGMKELLGSAFSQGMLNFTLIPELLVAAGLYLAVTLALSGMESLAARRARRIAGRGPVAATKNLAATATAA
ncbi:MAG TPA: amino acid ABC transporter permease [Microbacteriaceae bacterium]|nr:amino acid ABC transporter permease [Microbacteriaceae bacterium]